MQQQPAKTYSDGDYYIQISEHEMSYVRNGQKVHEARVFERDFQVNQLLKLRAFNSAKQSHNGGMAVVRVTHVIPAGTPGFQPGFCVIFFRLLDYFDETSLSINGVTI